LLAHNLSLVNEPASGDPNIDDVAPPPQAASRRRSKTRLLTVVLVIAVAFLLLISKGCAIANGWMGSPDADLEALERALDITIEEAHLHVVKRTHGKVIPCMSDIGPATRRAGGGTVEVDLGSEDADAVSRRIADVWRHHIDEWFAGGGVVTQDRSDARVTLYKGGGGLEAMGSVDTAAWPYQIGAYGPCYW
jgi:hypothetical protein